MQAKTKQKERSSVLNTYLRCWTILFHARDSTHSPRPEAQAEKTDNPFHSIRQHHNNAVQHRTNHKEVLSECTPIVIYISLLFIVTFRSIIITNLHVLSTYCNYVYLRHTRYVVIFNPIHDSRHDTKRNEIINMPYDTI